MGRVLEFVQDSGPCPLPSLPWAYLRLFLMPARLFALIIGIDHYKSGAIWDLNSCVEDAKRIRRFLIDDLNVPRDQICLLLNRQATKEAIEDNFMTHLVNNTAISHGDAIVIYFAGHGSVIPAPNGWFQGDASSVTGSVEVLCPYDHDTKQLGGRVAGISDRSMHALILELKQAKGDNITLITDCCFSPVKSRPNTLDRCITRWTPTVKAKPDDLYAGLWPGARGKPHTTGSAFYATASSSHILLAACKPGEKAVEGKSGGRFTHALLEAAAEVSLHRTSYSLLFDRLLQKMGSDDQRAMCLGSHKDRIVFGAIPFVVDARYVPVVLGDETRPRLEVGRIQGIVEGSEFTLHLHNYRASRNPSIATVVACEVHPTWCFGRVKSSVEALPKTCWAQITRWNNRRPFRVRLRVSLKSLCRTWELRRSLSTKAGRPPPRGGLNVIRVKNAAQADISLTVGLRNVAVETHDDEVTMNPHRIVTIGCRDPLDVINDAARFYLHLHRRNPESPLADFVSMELFRLEPASWTRIGRNLLQDGKATIAYEKGAVFTVILHNTSDVDLWPYLFYMDPTSFAITKIHDPGLSSATPPLPAHADLVIGSGQPGSEALSFALGDRTGLDFKFLKLFLAPKPIPSGMIEQGQVLDTLPISEAGADASPSSYENVWDTLTACVQLIRC
ncbi:putative caspase domain containing protein [Lyophyllum shimeji]|uniref:Caspase domain containing protein n=1 Tax=Lyophyllum shimeji TaxID=47721 RepID=A0A9P3PL35_LYOSH|nr:putative caspase domain containing protein [Lyophyllum shimeji]